MPYANVKLNLDLKPTGRRHVYFDTGAPVDTPILDRAGILPGHVIKGPAVVEKLDAKTLMFPSDTASVDADSPAHWSSQLRVQGIAQPVAKQIDADNQKHQCHCRKDNQPPFAGK